MNHRNAIIHDALRKLESWQQKPALATQRRFARHPARGEANICITDSQTADRVIITSNIRDISRGGIGVLTSEPVQINQLIRIELSQGDLTISTLSGSCRFVREIVAGAYLVGFEFALEASILMALGVTPQNLAANDHCETACVEPGEFVAPDALLS